MRLVLCFVRGNPFSAEKTDVVNGLAADPYGNPVVEAEFLLYRVHREIHRNSAGSFTARTVRRTGGLNHLRAADRS